jgi:hypothetical protein
MEAGVGGSEEIAFGSRVGGAAVPRPADRVRLGLGPVGAAPSRGLPAGASRACNDRPRASLVIVAKAIPRGQGPD